MGIHRLYRHSYDPIDSPPSKGAAAAIPSQNRASTGQILLRNAGICSSITSEDGSACRNVHRASGSPRSGSTGCLYASNGRSNKPRKKGYLSPHYQPGKFFPERICETDDPVSRTRGNAPGLYPSVPVLEFPRQISGRRFPASLCSADPYGSIEWQSKAMRTGYRSMRLLMRW